MNLRRLTSAIKAIADARLLSAAGLQITSHFAFSIIRFQNIYIIYVIILIQAKLRQLIEVRGDEQLYRRRKVSTFRTIHRKLCEILFDFDAHRDEAPRNHRKISDRMDDIHDCLSIESS